MVLMVVVLLPLLPLLPLLLQLQGTCTARAAEADALSGQVLALLVLRRLMLLPMHALIQVQMVALVLVQLLGTCTACAAEADAPSDACTAAGADASGGAGADDASHVRCMLLLETVVLMVVLTLPLLLQWSGTCTARAAEADAPSDQVLALLVLRRLMLLPMHALMQVRMMPLMCAACYCWRQWC